QTGATLPCRALCWSARQTLPSLGPVLAWDRSGGLLELGEDVVGAAGDLARGGQGSALAAGALLACGGEGVVGGARLAGGGGGRAWGGGWASADRSSGEPCLLSLPRRLVSADSETPSWVSRACKRCANRVRSSASARRSRVRSRRYWMSSGGSQQVGSIS